MLYIFPPFGDIRDYTATQPPGKEYIIVIYIFMIAIVSLMIKN